MRETNNRGEEVLDIVIQVGREKYRDVIFNMLIEYMYISQKRYSYPAVDADDRKIFCS